MIRLLHDHAGTGLCAVAPSGRVLGVSGLFLRALGLASPPSGAMLHDLLPLSETCPPCAGWHWLLDLPPHLPNPHAPNAPHGTTDNGRTHASPPRAAGVRGGVLVRTLPSAEAHAIPGCPTLHDPRDPAADTIARPATHARTGVLLQLHAPGMPNPPDGGNGPDEAARPKGAAGPAGQSGQDGQDGPNGQTGQDPARLPDPISHNTRPTPISPPVPDAHLRQALDALSVGLAHDFGNVVASILGFAEIAISRLHAAPAMPHGIDPMVLRSLDNIMLGCQRAREVIAFAQSIAGRVDLNAEPADLHTLVTAWCAELAGELPPDARWAVSCGLPPDRPTPSPPADTGQSDALDQPAPPDRLPPVRVDAARLREAFAEIWRNAAWAVKDAIPDQARTAQAPDDTGDASRASSAHPAQTAPDDDPAGRILVETTLAPASPRLPGRWVRVRVRDTGKGMDADTLCRMRDPYFSTKARHEGKGRGPARAAGIVRAHGGRLEIMAGPGLGCMVDILLPVAD
ncbi:ATP-binding protein [Nitratidesulfovibrio liaohensis]|uniref:histidine kinase n=1 Tax=Nitratidesulfovibrio liaohensis TaxID=2604158 RepID=A0ABY9R2X0_9BACT|nr:ATP-binding protein [Nitratidesulfovibrio liaohensis]WMW65173.1 ATP-binding protein [Nitratidesulfovibrio liaohensis]